MGEKMGRADVILSWPLDMVAQWGWVEFGSYPKVKSWRKSVLARDAWKRGLKKGNGYDLTVF